MNTDPAIDNARSQLQRLKTLTDVVYGAALVVVVGWLPLPEETEGARWLFDVFAAHPENLIATLLGLLFLIVYWMRSNTLMADLDRTSPVHAGLSIASVFFLLFLLFVVRINHELEGASARASESAAVALVGIFAGLAWWRARKEGLVRDGVTKKERVALQIEAYAEPLTALVTLPVAYVGGLWWNLSWLLYIPISRLLRRREERRP
jgi:hypothetical protein